MQKIELFFKQNFLNTIEHFLNTIAKSIGVRYHNIFLSCSSVNLGSSYCIVRMRNETRVFLCIKFKM